MSKVETFVFYSLPKTLRRHYEQTGEKPSASHFDADDDIQTVRVDIDDANRVDIWQWKDLEEPYMLKGRPIVSAWQKVGWEPIEVDADVTLADDEGETAPCQKT